MVIRVGLEIVQFAKNKMDEGEMVGGDDVSASLSDNPRQDFSQKADCVPLF